MNEGMKHFSSTTYKERSLLEESLISVSVRSIDPRDGKRFSTFSKSILVLSPLIGSLYVETASLHEIELSDPGNSIKHKDPDSKLKVVNDLNDVSHVLVVRYNNSLNVEVAPLSRFVRSGPMQVSSHLFTDQRTLLIGSLPWVRVSVQDVPSDPSLEEKIWPTLGFGDYLLLEQLQGASERFVYFGATDPHIGESARLGVTVVKITGDL